MESMENCIFSHRCTEPVCDAACPTLVETSYLLERNGITSNNVSFHAHKKEIVSAFSILKKSDGTLGVVISDNTISASNLLVYCAICQNWHGNRLHCNVYHLKFSNHVDSIQRSWSLKDTPEDLEYEQIWVSSAKVLIISNIDYVQFKEFQSQTLLNIIHNRKNNGLTTIVVSPKIQTLIGNGTFFERLKSMFTEAVVK